MLGLLVCLLIMFWLLRKLLDWLSAGGNNMRRVEGGWIVDPGGRDKPYFLRDETDDDEDDETEYDDCEEEEDDPSILERFHIIFHPEEKDTQEYQRAIKLKEGDRLLFEYDNPESMNDEDLRVLTAEDHVFIGHPKGVCPNYINFLINARHYTLEIVVTNVFVWEQSISNTELWDQMIIHAVIKKADDNNGIALRPCKEQTARTECYSNK